jgi:hypothetical protein
MVRPGRRDHRHEHVGAAGDPDVRGPRQHSEAAGRHRHQVAQQSSSEQPEHRHRVLGRDDLIDDVENVLLVTGVTPPTLDQMALASFIEDAAIERHLHSMRRRYRAKRDILIDALGTHLPGVRISGAAAGLLGEAMV